MTKAGKGTPQQIAVERDKVIKLVAPELHLNGVDETTGREELIRQSLRAIPTLAERCRLSIELLLSDDNYYTANLALQESSKTAEQTRNLAIGTFALATLTFLILVANSIQTYFVFQSNEYEKTKDKLEERQKRIEDSEKSIAELEIKYSKRESDIKTKEEAITKREEDLKQREKQKSGKKN